MSSRGQFEEAFSRWVGVRRAFGVWKGRVGLYAILKALGVGPGDEVILPGYTCVAVARPIKYLGARPVYVDIDPVTYNLDVDKAAAALTDKSRVIIAQHTYGYPADMDALLGLARRQGVEVIEDACLAVGSVYRGRRVGTLAKAAYWSTQWSKTFSTGFGGMATTDDPALAREMERLIGAEAVAPGWRESMLLSLLRQIHPLIAAPGTLGRAQAAYRWLSDKGLVTINPPGRNQVRISPAFFKTMSDGQARAGLEQLRGLEANLGHRRRMAQLYDRLLAERGWPVPRLPDHIEAVLVRYPVRVRDKAAAVRLARQRRLELGTWFDSPLHQCTEELDVYGYSRGACPVAERAAREVVNLPTHMKVTEAAARALVDLVCGVGPAEADTRRA